VRDSGSLRPRSAAGRSGPKGDDVTEQNQPKIQLRFEDRAEVTETFADSIGHWHFDGSSLRIDFLVTRFDQPSSPDTRNGRRLPACRLVLNSTGTADLLNECRRISAALEKAGLIKFGNPEPPKAAN
jgi:hypothetical protein